MGRSFPEENCMKNQVIFEELHYKVSELEQKKEVRIREYSPLRQEIVLRIGFCEGYFKAPGKGNYEWQKTWDKNAVDKYNQERIVLADHIRQAFENGYGDCLRDLIARANALPSKLVADKNQDPRIQIVGTWKWFTGYVVTIHSGGSFSADTGQHGTWSCVNPEKREFKLNWAKHDKKGGPWYDDLTLSGDGSSLDGKNQTNVRVWGRKIK